MIKRAVIKNFRMSVHLKCIGKLGSKVQGSGFRVQGSAKDKGIGLWCQAQAMGKLVA
jgi:hypothetical protein